MYILFANLHKILALNSFEYASDDRQITCCRRFYNSFILSFWCWSEEWRTIEMAKLFQMVNWQDLRIFFLDTLMTKIFEMTLTWPRAAADYVLQLKIGNNFWSITDLMIFESPDPYEICHWFYLNLMVSFYIMFVPNSLNFFQSNSIQKNLHKSNFR